MPQMSQVFEGACNWHADLQECPPELLPENVIFSTIIRIQRRFREFGSPTGLNTCNHASKGPPHPASSPAAHCRAIHPPPSCFSMIMHGPMLQGSVHTSRKLKMSQFFHGLHTQPNMSPIEHVWDALDTRVQQPVPVPANIQQLHTTIEEEWNNNPTSHNQQPDQLYVKEM